MFEMQVRTKFMLSSLELKSLPGAAVGSRQEPGVAVMGRNALPISVPAIA